MLGIGPAVVTLCLLLALSSIAFAGTVGRPVHLRAPTTPMATLPGYGVCGTFSWADLNDTLFGNCNGFFELDYRAPNTTYGWTVDNFTLQVGALAEITPSGAVTALLVPGYETFGSVSVASTPQEVNVTDLIAGNVMNAIGVNSSNGQPNGETPMWTPEDSPGSGGSTTWGSGSEVVGNSTLGIVFHYENGSADVSSRIQFDVSISGWPWASPDDSLGLEVEFGAYGEPTGVHFSYTASNDTIAEELDSNDSTVLSVAFGPTANLTGNPPSQLTVTDQVGLFPSGNPQPTQADALLTFSGAGGYQNMVYDPWVVFGTQSTPGGTTLPPPLLSAPNSPTLPLLAVGVIAVAVSLLGVATYRLRRRPIDEGLTPAG
jgi:hypothetical protein